MDPLRHYREIWLADFEFRQPDGETPEPLCLVAREFRTGRVLRFWQDELTHMSGPSFETSADTLFVAYYGSADLGCFLSLGWPLPTRIVDLFAEFRCLTNGAQTTCGNGLLGALAYYGLDSIDAAEKGTMRELAMRGGPYSGAERFALLDYCQTDVDALAKLLPAMLPRIDLPRALLRGRFMAAAARVERTGIPVDVESLGRLRLGWEPIKQRLVREINADYGVYVPSGRQAVDADGAMSFNAERFAKWLIQQGIPWPRLESGALALDDDTFRQMAKVYPAVAPLRELRHSLAKMKLFTDLAVGSDGRNRCLLSVFSSITGRNQPSNARFLFGPSCWLRGLIKPAPDRAVAYVDWSQQEFGIAAALSGDSAMLAAYASGDPYLAFAKQAGLAPADATKASHPAERERCKVCILAVQYGMESKSLATALGLPEAYARELLALHRTTYPRYWEWSRAAVDHGMLRGWLQTVFGWRVQVGSKFNPRALANYPMQANGAEMLRLACCLSTERGIQVCAPVHDALLVEGAADKIESVVATTQDAMREASRVVLNGFELRSDDKIVRYPDRYMDPRGERMWRTVMTILEDEQ